MAGHKIYARHSGVMEGDRLPIALIKGAIKEALSSEGVDIPCEVSVLITNDNAISGINREFRGIDKPTDVLSFPMQPLLPGEFSPGRCEPDPETGLVPLGEIILSAEHVRRQAHDYGHAREREAAYLTVHSVLHLLGYDHVDEAEGKRRMRVREDAIMRGMGL